MKISFSLRLFDKISFLDKLLFTKHLTVMLKSGIPLAEAIESIREQSQNLVFRRLLRNIGKDVANGKSLEQSLSVHPEVFDPLYLNLIKIGEQSGTLENNLQYLAEHLKKSYDFRKKVQSALMYPAIVLLSAVGVGGGISFFIMPKLVDLFKSLDVKLPLSTQILLFISTTMRDYGVIIFIALVMLLIFLRILIDLPSIRPGWHKLLLSLPVLGLFLQNVEVASFSRNLGIMLKSGLPIAAALEAEEKSTVNLVFKNYISHIRKAVSKGDTISQDLSNAHFRFMPLMVSKMIGVGEKTGKLDETLLYLGDFFEDEVDSYSKDFASILEPIVLLIIGGVVAFVALAIISPIYQVTSGIHK